MAAGFYSGKRVLVTGGAGFLGSYVVGRLLAAGAAVRVASRGAAGAALPPGVEAVAADLREPEACARAAAGMEMVFHLAAHGFGLGENVKRPAELLTANLLLNTNMLEAARRAGVERYLYTSSSAVYPARLTALEEEAPWDADPHPSERTFGWAKRTGEVQARAVLDQYGMRIAIVRPTNPYGPRDSLDVASSHVVPALIQRVLSGEDPLVVWGTGTAVRSFVHARDVARGMLLALERCATCEPLNLAAAETTSIGDLARLVVELTGSRAEVRFDPTRPEGAPRKVPSTAKAERLAGFRAEIGLREGLAETVEWIRAERGKATSTSTSTSTSTK